MKKRILFMLILTGYVINTYSQTNFNGDWYYDGGSFDLSLRITQVNSLISGRICATSDGGNFIDCDDSDIPNSLSGNVQSDSVLVTFTSTYCGKQGKAVIKKLNSNQISWKITEKPDGIYYFPDNAVLTLETYPEVGSFTMEPTSTLLTGNIKNNGANVTFNLAFYSNSIIPEQTPYKIATISENCRPSVTRTIFFECGCRFWNIIFEPNGDVYVKMCLVPQNLVEWDVPAYTSVYTGVLTYDL